MPTVVQIGNLKIQIYADDHNPPHFHVVTPDCQALIRIDSLAMLRGSLRRADFEAAIDWAREHLTEIKDEWDRLNCR